MLAVSYGNSIWRTGFKSLRMRRRRGFFKMTAPPHPPTLLSHRFVNNLQNGADISILPLFAQTLELYGELKVPDGSPEEAGEQGDNADCIPPPPRHQSGWFQSGSPVAMRLPTKGSFQTKQNLKYYLASITADALHTILNAKAVIMQKKT